MACIEFGILVWFYIFISVWNGCDIFFENKKDNHIKLSFDR